MRAQVPVAFFLFGGCGQQSSAIGDDSFSCWGGGSLSSLYGGSFARRLLSSEASASAWLLALLRV